MSFSLTSSPKVRVKAEPSPVKKPSPKKIPRGPQVLLAEINQITPPPRIEESAGPKSTVLSEIREKEAAGPTTDDLRKQYAALADQYEGLLARRKSLREEHERIKGELKEAKKAKKKKKEAEGE